MLNWHNNNITNALYLCVQSVWQLLNETKQNKLFPHILAYCTNWLPSSVNSNNPSKCYAIWIGSIHNYFANSKLWIFVHRNSKQMYTKFLVQLIQKYFKLYYVTFRYLPLSIIIIQPQPMDQHRYIIKSFPKMMIRYIILKIQSAPDFIFELFGWVVYSYAHIPQTINDHFPLTMYFTVLFNHYIASALRFSCMRNFSENPQNFCRTHSMQKRNSINACINKFTTE